MVKTYEKTLFIENLTNANVKIYLYENSKYSSIVGNEKKLIIPV